MVEVQSNEICYSPREYQHILEGINIQRQQELSVLTQECLAGMPPDVAVVVVGSDGKLERHPQSRTELVLLSDNYYPHLPEQVFEALAPYQEEHSLEFDYNNMPGYYWLGQEEPFAYQYQNPNNIFPGFIFNSQLIHGMEGTRLKARERILGELAADNELGKRINRHMRNQLSDYRRAMKKGSTTHHTYFDINSQTVFYNDHKKILGFKGSFIRGIQRVTGLHMAHLVKEYPDLISEVAETFPTETMRRIHRLVEYDRISPSLGTQTISAYNWFLQKHHEVQELFKQEDEAATVSTSFDKNKFTKHQEKALEFAYSI